MLKIPDIYIPGFEILYSISEKDFEKIIKIIKDLPIGAGVKKHYNAIKPELNVENIELLSNTIYSFGSLLTNENLSKNEIIDEISNSFKELSKIKVSDNEFSQFKEKLSRLLDSSLNLKCTFKTLNLLTENENIYLESKIISDIRLVFNEDLSDKNRNAVIIHQLKIVFEKNSKKNNAFYSMDKNDLEELKKQIDRALMKDELIQKNYKSSISFVNITE